MTTIATYTMTCDDNTTRTAEVRVNNEGWQLVDTDGADYVFAEGEADSYDAACAAGLAAARADRCRTGEVEAE